MPTWPQTQALLGALLAGPGLCPLWSSTSHCVILPDAGLEANREEEQETAAPLPWWALGEKVVMRRQPDPKTKTRLGPAEQTPFSPISSHFQREKKHLTAEFSQHAIPENCSELDSFYGEKCSCDISRAPGPVPGRRVRLSAAGSSNMEGQHQKPGRNKGTEVKHGSEQQRRDRAFALHSDNWD